MKTDPTIAVVATFDSKAEEHFFLKNAQMKFLSFVSLWPLSLSFEEIVWCCVGGL